MPYSTLSTITDCNTLIQRFVSIRFTGGRIFDLQEQTIVTKNDVIELCMPRKIFDLWEANPHRKTCDIAEVGYDSQNRYSLPCKIGSEAKLNILLHSLLSCDGDI